MKSQNRSKMFSSLQLLINSAKSRGQRHISISVADAERLLADYDAETQRVIELAKQKASAEKADAFAAANVVYDAGTFR